MPKQCLYDLCNRNQFGGKYCSYHQWCRTDKKKKCLPTDKATVKRTAIKKRSPKKIIQDREEARLTKLDHIMYQEIWEERPHIDYETHKPIWGEPLTIYFHHVLPKRAKKDGGYPEFRHCKWNIVILAWDTHTNAENDLDLVPKVKAYRDYLLKTYVK